MKDFSGESDMNLATPLEEISCKVWEGPGSAEAMIEDMICAEQHKDAHKEKKNSIEYNGV